jgi:hypothetical protein
MPIAYGKFNADGSKFSGTSNISVSRVLDGTDYHFIVTVSGVDLSTAIGVASTSFGANGGYIINVDSYSGDATKFNVTILRLSSGVRVASDFQIVIYKTN